MSFEKYRLKLIENSNTGDQKLPRFSLSYRVKREDPRHVSYDILTALSDNSDIIIEIDTSFLITILTLTGSVFNSLRMQSVLSG